MSFKKRPIVYNSSIKEIVYWYKDFNWNTNNQQKNL